MIEPDMQGFKDAQNVLIQQTGEDVTFIAFAPKVYDPAVQLDPESGEPFDPTLQPTSGGEEIAVTLRVVPIEGRTRANDETEVGPSGIRDTWEPVFIVQLADTADLAGAEYVDHNGERYHITDVKNDDDRTLVFTEAT